MRVTHTRFLIKLCIYLFIPVYAVCQPVINYLGIEQGLSNNSVRSIYQDHKGFMWFGTYDGLNRYDGYSFTTYRNEFGDSNSLVNNTISTIGEDLNHALWIGTRKGVSRYNSLDNTFTTLYAITKTGTPSLITDVIKDIKVNAANDVFVASETQGLYMAVNGKLPLVRIPFVINRQTFFDYGTQSLLIDNAGTVWVVVQDKGLARWNATAKRLELAVAIPSKVNCITGSRKNIWIAVGGSLFTFNPVSGAYTKIQVIDSTTGAYNGPSSMRFSEGGKLWISTYESGIIIYDTLTKTVSHILQGDGNYALTSNAVYAIYVDQQSRKWIGTARGGINIIDPKKQNFRVIAHEPGNTNSLGGNSISSVCEYSDSVLWIGVEGLGVKAWNRKSNRFSTISEPGNSNTLQTASITNIKKDDNGDIWMASFSNGIYLYKNDSHTFRHYDLFNTISGKQNRIAYCLYIDKNKNVWVSSLRQGDFKGALYKLNRREDRFEVFDNEVSDVFSMFQDTKGQLWCGNLNQLIQLDSRNKEHVLFDFGYSVRAIHEDRQGRFWIGTEGGGLILFDRTQGKILARYTTRQGLCNNSVLTFLEDAKGNLWMSTLNGLSCFNYHTGKFLNFYQSDGLQSNQFHYNAALALHSGDLAFGGIKGLSIFSPAIDSSVAVPPLFFTAINVNGSPVDGRHPFVKSTGNEQISKLEVPYSEAVFAFNFTALEYSSPSQIAYSYYMQGWDKGWNNIGNNRSATYTHLSEGTYTFRVKCSAEGRGTASREISMIIRVLPPWYRTWWAYLFYAAVVFAAIYGYYRYKAKQARLLYKVALADMSAAKERAEREKENAEHAREKTEREKEKILSEKEKELSEKRISFFTNISHEFRTPLSLIINPIKDMLKKEANGNDTSLPIIHRNAKRLLSLVDQLLLFRKVDSDLDRLKGSEINISEIAREVFLCFTEQAKSKNIDYNFRGTDSKMTLFADGEKMEIIFYNLISNALKYTPDGGTVSVVITQDDRKVMISIADSGPGIPDTVGEKLYEKFYQVHTPQFKSKPGFGIGLYMVKQFVQAHKGSISFTNNEDGGVTFTVGLLKGKSHFLPDEIVRNEVYETRLVQALMEDEDVTAAKQPQPSGTPVLQNEALLLTDKKTILIVDDEEQMRNYVASIFKDTFIVYECADGSEGLELVKKYGPDMIISDIKMAEMDGVSFCKMVKENPSFSHIPFILLTGTSSQELQLEGIEVGADDYIMKPFDSEILLARVNTLLRNRTNLQKYFYNEITLNKNDQLISAEYKDFLNDCIKIVEKHLDDEDFGVKTFTKEIGMSYSNLLRKVKYVSGLSINEFIRFIRLRKAAELLINTDYNVNETAFSVGISDIKYFRKQFHKLFGLNPSDFIRQYRKTLGKQFKVNKDAFSSHTGEE